MIHDSGFQSILFLTLFFLLLITAISPARKSQGYPFLALELPYLKSTKEIWSPPRQTNGTKSAFCAWDEGRKQCKNWWLNTCRSLPFLPRFVLPPLSADNTANLQCTLVGCFAHPLSMRALAEWDSPFPSLGCNIKSLAIREIVCGFKRS